MNIKSVADFVDEQAIDSALLHARKVDRAWFRDCLQRAAEPGRLTLREIAVLLGASGELREELFAAAAQMKQSIFGSRVTLFAPLYLSSAYANECVYCDHRHEAQEARWLRLDQVAEETEAIVEQGHKRVLMISGDVPPEKGFGYLLDAIGTVYGTKSGHGEVRRVHANFAPPTVEQFYALREAKLAEYQCFQQSYHRRTYDVMHEKSSFDWRATVMHRALASGIADVGVGVLYGLHDSRWETLALIQHIRELEAEYGIGSRTISVPRLRRGIAPRAVNDEELLTIIAVLRLAVPYAGIAISSQEKAEIRRKSLAIGVSQMSAGVRGDKAHELVRDAAELGFVPSFCTACYRVGRTGASYKHLASHPNVIRKNCDVNALATLLEYLCDYPAGDAQVAGEHLIEQQLGKMPATQRAFVTAMLERIRRGERDSFV